MPDPVTITAILGNLKVAIDIAKAIRSSDVSIERAELKLRLAEMIGALADAKIEVIEVQELLAEKDKQLLALEAAFQSKDALVKHYDAYYAVGPNGGAIGEPFCAHCWQVEHRKYSLANDSKDNFVRVCISCSHKYSSRLVPKLAAEASAADA